MTEQYWLVWKTDGAILGHVSGTKTQRVLEGPFDDWDVAMEKKRNHPRSGCGWSTVIESDTRPENTKEEYEFVDARYEFNDY